MCHVFQLYRYCTCKCTVPLGVSEDEETSWSKVLRWNGRGVLLHRAALVWSVISGAVVLLLLVSGFLYLGVEFFYVALVREQTSCVVIALLVFGSPERILSGE